ncbi:MAG: hypothetical protein AAF587_16760 [Bacteroidota bacterium]
MNAFPLQLLIDLHRSEGELSYPKFLQEIQKKSDFSDFNKLSDFLNGELQNASIQSQESVDYFLFISEHALWYHFLGRNHDHLIHGIELFKHRLTAMKSIQVIDEVPVNGWYQYLDLIQIAFLRVLRHVPIETYEEHISNLNWSAFDASFIPQISTLLGIVYSQEEDSEQRGKARIWLAKSIRENAPAGNLLNYYVLASYFQAENKPDSADRMREVVQQLKASLDELPSGRISNLFHAGIFELDAEILRSSFSLETDGINQLEQSQLKLKELETSFAHRDDLPSFSRARVESIIAGLYGQLFHMTDDDLEQASFAKQASQHIDHSIHLADKYKDDVNEMLYRLTKSNISVKTGSQLTEKEMKELVQYQKKRQDYPYYIQAMHVYLDLLERNGVSSKSYDLFLEIFKQGNKRIEEGGFYLITKGLGLANRVFIRESKKPGVSWIVANLDSFFEKVMEVIDSIESIQEHSGVKLVEEFRETYLAFEPASHFNIKVYFQFQLYMAKSLRIGAILHNDTMSLKMANKLISEFENENNPLSFIQAEWEEFKKVPNSVRNKTLNKCINISKGDLPLAAEHLDFSYRNLRSYITFKEVNRLGFFLDLQQTNNRQLELGIRYMFFDLYKKGTIFEVVFDMPKFLVEHSKSGFYSQNLEQELNIKGTTAKKYIKIMMEIGLIRQDKTTGRKHYYRLIRENVMNRLGKDKNTLIGSADAHIVG